MLAVPLWVLSCARGITGRLYIRVYSGVPLRYNMHLRGLVYMHTLILLYNIIQHITIWQGILILQDNTIQTQ